MTYSGMGGVIAVPAGQPICDPKVVVGFSDDDVLDWAYDVMDKGREKNLNYSPEAIKYWARYFWPIGTPDHKRVCAILDTLNRQAVQ